VALSAITPGRSDSAKYLGQQRNAQFRRLRAVVSHTPKTDTTNAMASSGNMALPAAVERHSAGQRGAPPKLTETLATQVRGSPSWI